MKPIGLTTSILCAVAASAFGETLTYLGGGGYLG